MSLLPCEYNSLNGPCATVYPHCVTSLNIFICSRYPQYLTVTRWQLPIPAVARHIKM